MKSLIDHINEAKKPKVMSIKKAFSYIASKLGAACRFSRTPYGYEISPGYGNVADWTFTIEDDPRNDKGPILYFDYYHNGPNAFTRDKSIQTPELYFEKRFMGNTEQYWILTQEVIDKCLAACK